jgi:hypothetical protein
MSVAFGPQMGCVLNAPSSSARSAKGTRSPTAAADMSSSRSQISYRKGHSSRSSLNHVATYVIFIQNITAN